jgi:GTP cyclohydrolase I
MAGRNCSRCGKPGAKLFELTPISNQYLCGNCEEKIQEKLRSEKLKFVGGESIQRGAELILQGLKEDLGLDIDNQHFIDTPRRVARAYMEIFEGIKNTQQQTKEILSTAFDSNQDEMIIISRIHVFSMCPHHLLPVEYYVDVAYIPEGKVLGLSKIPRLVEVLCKRPVIQEDVTTEIVDCLMTLKPLGAACRIEGQHFCMRMRGIKKPESIAVTNSIRGAFEDSTTRKEFMDHLLKLKRNFF